MADPMGVSPRTARIPLATVSPKHPKMSTCEPLAVHTAGSGTQSSVSDIPTKHINHRCGVRSQEKSRGRREERGFVGGAGAELNPHR